MSYAGVWQGSPLWSYLVRYDSNGPLWSTSWLSQRMLDPLGSNSTQCCDCVIDAVTGQFAIQFESFPPYWHVGDSPGNGGDLVCLTSDNFIKAFATQDGGHPSGLYYFCGPGEGQPADGRVGGWVIAGPDLAPTWNSVVCWIDQSFAGPYNPVGALSPSYTRYCLAQLDVPYLVNGGAPGTFPRSSIISEHYSGSDPTTAVEMERTHYSQWLGKTRWELWTLPGVQQIDPTLAMRAAPFPFGYPSASPLNPNLVLSDCRSFINWTVGADPTFTVQRAGWPGGVILP